MKNIKEKKIFTLYAKIVVSFLFLWGTSSLTKEPKPLKILTTVAVFPKINSISSMNQMTGLIDRGHDVRIFAPKKGNCVKVQEDVIKYDLMSRAIYEFPSSLDDYDVVMFQMGTQIRDIRKTHNFKGKIVACLRGYDITGHLKENPHAYDEHFETCDFFFPVCGVFKQALENAGCDPDKIAVIHSAIDFSKFKFQKKTFPKKGTINIVSAGRLVEKKGFGYSIRAVAKLIKRYPNIQYTIIGDGVLKLEYEQLIKKLGVEDKIKIVNWFVHEEYINVLNKAHIFIAPSVTAENNDQEGIPNVLKEAMAVGLCVIATDHSGNSELIEHGVSGILVPERDSKAICRAIKHILNNPKKLLPMQLAALKKVHEEFDKEKENDKLEAILTNLCGQ